MNKHLALNGIALLEQQQQRAGLPLVRTARKKKRKRGRDFTAHTHTRNTHLPKAKDPSMAANIPASSRTP